MMSSRGDRDRSHSKKKRRGGGERKTDRRFEGAPEEGRGRGGRLGEHGLRDGIGRTASESRSYDANAGTTLKRARELREGGPLPNGKVSEYNAKGTGNSSPLSY